MTEQQARDRGFTLPIFANSSMYYLELLVQPGTHFDDAFRAYDINSGEMLTINGWLFVIEHETEADDYDPLDDFNYVGSRHHY